MEHGTIPRRAELVKFLTMFLTFPEGFFQAVGLCGRVWGGVLQNDKVTADGEENEGSP